MRGNRVRHAPSAYRSRHDGQGQCRFQTLDGVNTGWTLGKVERCQGWLADTTIVSACPSDAVGFVRPNPKVNLITRYVSR